MFSRSTLRSSKSAFTCLQCAQRRSFAATTSRALNYEASEAAGTKLLAASVPGPTSTLAFVSKAGSRYEWVPGLSIGLQQFAFRNTDKRFAVRIVRETELLGSEFFTDRTREAVVFGAKFMKEDLPYFVELFAEIARDTKYQQYMIDEVIAPTITEATKSFLSDPAALAQQLAHTVAFHRGLGNPLLSTNIATIPRLVAEEVEAYAAASYVKSNFALVGSGVESAELSKWTGEFFKDVAASAPSGLGPVEASSASTAKSQYYGGEHRVSAKSNAVVIAFPGSSLPNGSAYKPEIDALATLLGGESSIKWAKSNSLLGKIAASHVGVNINTDTSKYSDSGLVFVTITGSAKGVAAAAKEAASAIKSLAPAAEDIKKAIAQAKFKAYDIETGSAPALDKLGLSAINGKVQTSEDALKGVSSVTESAIKSAAKALLESKVTYVAVGDLSVLPYAEELGLKA